MTKKEGKEKEKYLDLLSKVGRQFSDATLLFHELVAQKAGLAGADHKYLGILLRKDSMTAGELAAETGLTTGAITGVIDRLEKRGFVKREKDPHDRRKVVIVPDIEIANKILGPIFGRLQERSALLYNQFTSKELEIILHYMDKTQEMVKELMEELKEKK